MKNSKKRPIVSDFQNEAQIAAAYKNFVTLPNRSVQSKRISEFLVSFPSSVNRSDSLEDHNLLYKSSDNESKETNKITCVSRQSVNSMQRPQSERPRFRLSTEAAEYQEEPFSTFNKEYEVYKKIFDQKVKEVTGIHKYEKKNKIQEIIENEYNFNKYGEEASPQSRKVFIRKSSKIVKTPASCTHHRQSNQFQEPSFNLKNKITFSFQKMSQDNEEFIKRPKKDKLFFEKIKEKYFLKIKKVFDENNLKESQKNAQEEIARVLKEFKEYVDQSQEERSPIIYFAGFVSF